MSYTLSELTQQEKKDRRNYKLKLAGIILTGTLAVGYICWVAKKCSTYDPQEKSQTQSLLETISDTIKNSEK